MMISNQSSYLREVRESQKVFSALVSAMEKSHKAVVAVIEERQKEEETRVETLVKEIKQEIQELRKEISESDPQVSGDQSDEPKQFVMVNILMYSRQHDHNTEALSSCNAEYCFHFVAL